MPYAKLARCLLHTEVKVVDDNGTELPWGEVESWLLAQYNAGLRNNPERKSFVDGWLRTGDAARFDDEALFIVDRWKDMYISGGENVYPGGKRLYQLPEVAEAAIIGVPDGWGETGKAVVVSKPISN